MTCRELLNSIRERIEKDAANLPADSKITVTKIFGDSKECLFRAMIPAEHHTIRVLDITVKELCLYGGLGVHEHLVP